MSEEIMVRGSDLKEKLEEVKREITELQERPACELGIFTEDIKDTDIYERCPYCSQPYWCGHFKAAKRQEVRGIEFDGGFCVGGLCPAWNAGKILRLKEKAEDLELAQQGWEKTYFSFVGHFLSPIQKPTEIKEEIDIGVESSIESVKVRTYATERDDVAYIEVEGYDWEEKGFIRIPEGWDSDKHCCAANPHGSAWRVWE